MTARLFLFSCLVWFCANPGAWAATIEIAPLTSPDSALVTISGKLEVEDAAAFKAKTASTPKAVVALLSNGGSLFAGIAIGEAIRLKNYTTLVPDGGACASACALAWLGGTRRLMGPSAKIGFHSASDARTGAVSGAGDAFIGAYLNKIGTPDRAIFYLTNAAPSAIQWLDVVDAAKLGIDVEILKSSGRPPAPAAVAGEKTPDAPAIDGQTAAGGDLHRDIEAECSERADARGLHGDPRKRYRTRCIATDAEPE